MSDEQQPKEKNHNLQVIATFFAAVASLGSVVHTFATLPQIIRRSSALPVSNFLQMTLLVLD